MVGPMLLMKMFHCQRMNINKTKRKKRIVEESVSDGNSHEESAQDSKVKNECSNNKYMDILCGEQTCRVCLNEGYIPIYGDGQYVDNSEELNTFGGIKLTVDDPYPKFLCQQCNSLLECAILLRKTAQQSDEKLKQPPEDLLIVEKIEREESGHVYDMDSPADSDVCKVMQHKPYHCTECNIKFKSLKGYNKHKISLEHKPSKCDLYIAKKKNSKETVNSIKDEPTDANICKTDAMKKVKKYNYCNRCKLTFDSFQEYNEHRMSEEHENMRHVCPICNRSYTALYFKKHLSLHKGEAPYMCDICGKNFIVQGQLHRHRLTHFYELPFKCSLCPYKGRFRESLRMHMRSHTGEKPYQCNQCPSRFINKSNLNKHMRTHKGNHDFKCDTCGRGFYTKRELELHFKVDHTGIKDHICGVCSKAFGYRKQMMKHQLKVHKRQKMKSGRTPLYLKVETMKDLGENIAI